MHILYCKFDENRYEQEQDKTKLIGSIVEKYTPGTSFIQIEFKTRKERRDFISNFPCWVRISYDEFENLKRQYLTALNEYRNYLIKQEQKEKLNSKRE